MSERCNNMFRSKIIHEGGHYIRYDIPSELVHELFEDEQKLDNFIEHITKDFLYKLGLCAQIEWRYNVLKEALERSESDVCNKENCQDV